MNVKMAGGEYEVLSPWADVDPVQVQVRGITPRVTDLAGKKIGILRSIKASAATILPVVERKLKERYPTCETSWFKGNTFSVSELEKERLKEFEEWIKEQDTFVVANAD